MSYNNSRDLSRRRKLSDSFDDLEATMKEWDYFRKSIPAVATSTSTQPSGTPSPRVPTPTSARVSTPVPATASSTSFSAAPSPVQRSMRSTTAYKPQTPDRSEESGEESVPEVAPLCVRHKLARINNSPDIASHKDVDDAGRVPSPAFHRNVDVASTGSYTTYTNYTNILTRSPSPQKSFNTYNDTSGSASPSPSPARESGYNYTLTHSSYDVDSPVSQSPARYTPTGLHSTDSSATATGFIPTPIYPTPTPTSPPTTSPRKWRDSRQVPEEILEYDFNRETPQAVLDAEEAVKKRDETDVRVAEMRNLTQTAAMMELFFQAENALAAEDVDRAEWKTREGLTIAQELNDAPYIERGGYLMRVAAALENEKMREAYERAHGVQYVANGDKEGERESENDDDDEDNDLAVIGCENMADLDDQDGSKDSENNEIERNGLEIRSINTEESPLLKGVRFLHPQSGSRNSLSHTGGEERYQCPYPSEEQQNDLFPTDEPQRPRKGKPQKERKTRLRSRGLKSQYVKAKPIVLPTVYRSWEDPHSDGEEVMPVFRLVNHKRHRPQYSETCFWSYLLRLKPVSFIKTKPPHIRKRMLRTLPRVWYTPDDNIDVDQPLPPSTFHSHFWPTHSTSLVLKEADNNDMEWLSKYNSSPFKSPRSEFTFRAHIPVSMMAPRSRPTTLFPEQEYEYLADEDDLENFKEDVGDLKLNMGFLEFERFRIQHIVELKKKGLLPPRAKEKRVPRVFDFRFISWVRLLDALVFLYWFCFVFWKVGFLKRLHIPVWNPFEILGLGLRGIVLELFRLG